MTPRLPALVRPHAAAASPRDPFALPPSLARGLLAATLVASLAAAVAVLTWTASQPVLEAAAFAVAWLRGHDDVTGRSLLTAVLAGAAALPFAVARARADDPDRPVRIPGGRGTIPAHELAAWLRDEVEARADVRSAQVIVQSKGKGVRVAARILVTADARLRDTSQGASLAIEQLLATRAGVPLAGEPVIGLNYEELRLHPRADA